MRVFFLIKYQHFHLKHLKRSISPNYSTKLENADYEGDLPEQTCGGQEKNKATVESIRVFFCP